MGSFEVRHPTVPSQRLEIRRRLGYLPQEFGIYRSFTVREFLSYAAWLKEMPGTAIPAAVEDAADRSGSPTASTADCGPCPAG
ncbi:hypothetical protein OHT76_00915 [Streptomyces sp. NBC_00287]|uniref:hypothetical protein n=1 Tax=Streptomyces sp. NBC_00287 TaxID=2975702 RepID=UPI002E2CDFB0|nr:hypothetical protein [Streptomyces sp. NBC_00287]